MTRTILFTLAAATLSAAACGSAFGKAHSPFAQGSNTVSSTTAGQGATIQGRGLNSGGVQTAFTLIELLPVNPPPKVPSGLQENRQSGKTTAKKVPGKEGGRLTRRPRR